MERLMIVRAVKLRVVTPMGDFGFQFAFSRNLTIIRGANSTGKSTLFNSILYALGMEELVGGRGPRTLPYAVEKHLEYEGQRVVVLASEILLEIENSTKQVVTLRRAIRDQTRDSKLVEIFRSAHLTHNEDLGIPTATFLHDTGAAKRKEGFHFFLEQFMDLKLPTVPTTNGGETKLYLQTIFAALAVEQKRGWTDYIANIPFFGIRDARVHVVEYLLALEVFELNALRYRLKVEAAEISTMWSKASDDFVQSAEALGVIIKGLPHTVTPLFDVSSVKLEYVDGDHVRQFRTT
jgi:hypothetical protein